MTKRQQVIAEWVAAHREDLRQECAHQPIGHSTSIRVVVAFDQPQFVLLLTKTGKDTYDWREDSPAFTRKGFTAPKPRAL